MGSLLIRNSTIITPETTLSDASVWISDGKIQAIGKADEFQNRQADQVIDATGLLLAPGFIELQFNGAFGKDFTQEPDSIWEVAQKLPRYGITTFLPTVITSPLETITRAIEVIQHGCPPDFHGALPLGLHLEGPFLNPGRKGAHNPAYIRLPDSEAVKNWSPQNGVRVVTLAPEQPGALDLIRQLCQQGVVVSAGHSLASYEQALAAFEAGVTYGTHLFNAMPPLEHRTPNLIGALLTTPNIPVGLIVDGIHVHPAAVKLAWIAKGNQGITLVTDAMAALGMNPGVYELGDFEVRVDENSARLADGTLAGSILEPAQSLRNLMQYTGCSLSEAIPAITSTPARVLGLTDRGKIKPGFIADLVLLTPQGFVQQTIIQGKVAYHL